MIQVRRDRRMRRERDWWRSLIGQ